MIGIVGGGLTGLALGHHLARAGIPHRVFEASDRPGGVIRSVRVEGRTLDLGPQRARLSPQLRRLVSELSLEEELLEAPPDLPLYAFRRGRLRPVPLSMGDFLRTDLLSARGKLRVLLEPFTGGTRPGEDVAGFFVRKLGREAYEAFLGPLYGGLYASDPAEMLVDLSLGRVLEELGVGRSLLLAALLRGRRARAALPACSFRGGMAALPEALASENRDRVRLGSPVREILPGRGDGFVLVTDGEELPVDVAVLTAPAPAAAELLRDAAPDAAARLASLRYNPLAVVHLVRDGGGNGSGRRSGELPLRGYGYQVAFGEEMETRGVTWNHSLFPDGPGREGLFTAYLGGMKNPALVDDPDDRLGALAADELHRATGVEVRPIHVHRTRVPAWDRSWAALDGLRLPDGILLEGAYVSRPGILGRLAAARRLAESLPLTRSARTS